MSGSRQGFSLVELMVAMVILAAGLLVMASASGFSSLTVQIAGNRTARAAAVASEIERLRAQTYTTATWNAIATKPQTSADTLDGFTVWYTVSRPRANLINITLTSSGKSYVPRRGWQTLQQTFSTTLAKPSTS